ncbi:hypothetical protein OUZ56_010814 [Daphnia magna]|uniref:Uncharacterized protein n=1 Tax=Daphnia magna TaxID=35525 RepID=A0ABQ9YYR2_9CRUS|nr:hypothetical protein OUZ56_010814 [Daphnia magna]
MAAALFVRGDESNWPELRAAKTTKPVPFYLPLSKQNKKEKGQIELVIKIKKTEDTNVHLSAAYLGLVFIIEPNAIQPHIL